ncbi:hypothetical protein BDA96_01G399600 [Sorghum bicolor]|uniref:Uncharacterized protein n=2 Tax=Sorghum bicolor TaxID=4558 RepID=A0A921S3Z8_SORBI|nr:hypothetical protein BDA96_01G399600 [Sorghum bicolor]OQU92611.1 hypothetical protein SORBI_3001G375650 [Sorghum bicolor]
MGVVCYGGRDWFLEHRSLSGCSRDRLGSKTTAFPSSLRFKAVHCTARHRHQEESGKPIPSHLPPSGSAEHAARSPSARARHLGSPSLLTCPATRHLRPPPSTDHLPPTPP